MKRRLFAAIIIAVFASFFASQNPDGLDKVSKVLGFADSAKENGAIMKDYMVGFIGHPQISTALAGIIGVFLVYGIFELIILFAKKRKSNAITQEK
ncbi:MAG: hypothetical protein A2231_04690 [Candidatus Firestonebacteria bacterium RIFOXYA2_FULL_40_8]|nr:MAG: hypothetical protein A2231_04690 [Candidatus Firestonebacteria bacterium RIFOXYA2_FULL_40_8]